ncbi:MAG: response regulator [Desulfobacca sp.]|nr:response regulator [Desulfobacca sp.]
MGVKILVVDDDQRTREALTAILRRAGYEVTPLDSGDRLEENLRTERYAGAVIDYHLPTRNGLELAQSVREILPDCQIILISSEFRPFKDAGASSTVVNRFIPKPFSKNTFLRVIGELCPLKPE